MDIFVPILKVDASRREVHGVMAEEARDRANEIFDYESSKPYVQAWSREIEKTTDGKSAGNVRGQCGIRRRRPDREDEAAPDRMGIGGDHSIGDDIAAGTQALGQPDSYGLVGLRHVLGSGDRLAGSVEDADRDR